MASLISFLGDLYLPQAYDVDGALTGAVIGNLEYALGQDATPWPGKINLKADQLFLRETFGSNIFAVCLANNHIMDFGESGLRTTIEALTSQGVAFFGAGSLSERCCNPLVVNVGDHCIGLSGYVASDTHAVFASSSYPGVAPIDLSLIREDIAVAQAKGASSVFVHLHWGDEEVSFPRPANIKIAHQIADLGPTAIIGHHPHCVQPFEIVNGVPIFYSIGNCIFPHLELPAGFDQSGQATLCFRKYQEYWNRSGLAITVDPLHRQYSVARTHFDGSRCRVALPHHTFTSTAGDPKGLMLSGVRFRVAYAFGEVRKKLFTAFRRRTVPQWKHLVSLCRILRGAVFPPGR